MFKNIGGKIKALAITLAGLGIGFSIVYFIVLIKEDLLKVGSNAAILIAVISLVCAMILYGFGQLIENSDKLVKMKEAELAEKQKDEVKKIEPTEKKEKASKVEKKDVLKSISPTIKEKIKKIISTSKTKVASLKKDNADWLEEIKSLTDEELVDRIDNDHSWQYSYIILCCHEYNERLNPKKETQKKPDKKIKK